MAAIICTECKVFIANLNTIYEKDLSRFDDDKHMFVRIAKGNTIEGVEAK